ncbi:coiled-coil domain-containing protein 96 isoform X4 [Aethina tumida]|uniref:coiled-coil domain-containing protein 96 isoform X4 n=1 Tax=Aethina tumida TaxID=116153 RepID=UPI002148A607|nr:coiled-coil domain-containing protein 96 isoform X4 [Aethina tumida]
MDEEESNIREKSEEMIYEDTGEKDLANNSDIIISTAQRASDDSGALTVMDFDDGEEEDEEGSKEYGKEEETLNDFQNMQRKIHYDASINPQDFSNEIKKVSGDFIGLTPSQTLLVDYTTIIPETVIVEEVIEEEEEEEAESQKSSSITLDEPVFDREELVAKLSQIMAETEIERSKNHFLEKKILEFMRRRKMESGLRDFDVPEGLDFLRRYKQQLTAFKNQRDYYNQQYSLLNEELSSAEKRTLKTEKMRNDIQHKLCHREKEIGRGLIHSKTGKAISDQLVENLVNRQNRNFKQISEMRLKYLIAKIRNQKIQDKINKANVIDGDLSLMDYEVMRNLRNAQVEKMEEREDELNKLRTICTNSIQVLAHLKEKLSTCDLDLEIYIDKYNDAEYLLKEKREYVTQLKRERDRIRHRTYNLKEQSGLLTKLDLLRDMEESVKELKIVKKKLRISEQNVQIKKIKVTKRNPGKSRRHQLSLPKLFEI